jgi:hypothetical protein
MPVHKRLPPLFHDHSTNRWPTAVDGCASSVPPPYQTMRLGRSHYCPGKACYYYYLPSQAQLDTLRQHNFALPLPHTSLEISNVPCPEPGGKDKSPLIRATHMSQHRWNYELVFAYLVCYHRTEWSCHCLGRQHELESLLQNGCQWR